MTTIAELELALAHLQRAKEWAQFYGRPPETIRLIEVLQRAIVKVKSELSGETRSEQKSAAATL